MEIQKPIRKLILLLAWFIYLLPDGAVHCMYMLHSLHQYIAILVPHTRAAAREAVDNTVSHPRSRHPLRFVFHAALACLTWPSGKGIQIPGQRSG